MGRGGHFFVAGELGVKFFLCVRLRVRCPSHPPIAQVVAIDERATAGVFVASGRGQSRAYTVRQLSLPQPPKGSTGNGKQLKMDLKIDVLFLPIVATFFVRCTQRAQERIKICH